MTRKNKVLLITVISAIVLALSIGAGTIYARYTSSDDDKSQQLGAHSFYFGSDLLSEEGTELNYSASVNEVSFNIYNYKDSLRFSTLPINYTVTVKLGDVTIKTITGILEAGGLRAETITIDNLESGNTYDVTVVGENGFSSTLLGSISINDEAGFYISVDSSNPDYVMVKIRTEGSSGTAKLTVPEGLIPDNTYPGMLGLKTGDQIERYLEERKSAIFRFLKPVGYDGGYDFTATLNDTTPAEPENID